MKEFIDRFFSQNVKFNNTSIENFITISLVHLETVLNHFLNGNLASFDSHVGDACCQIRAVKIIQDYLYMKRYAESHAYRNAFNLIKNHPNSRTQFNNLSYTKKIEFLYLSYILTIYKIKSPNNKTMINLDKFSADFELSKSRSIKLIKSYQRKLSELSCDFIIEAAITIKYKYLDLVRCLRLKGDDDRELIATYYVSDILYQLIQLKHLPMKILLHFKSHTKTIVFNNKLKTPCIEFHCHSEHEKKSIDIMESIRVNFKNLHYMNQASHPQYCGLKLKHLKNNPFEVFDAKSTERKKYKHLETLFKEHRDLASYIGCSRSHPKTCFIKHIKPGSVPLIEIAKQFTSEKISKEGIL